MNVTVSVTVDGIDIQNIETNIQSLLQATQALSAATDKLSATLKGVQDGKQTG